MPRERCSVQDVGAEHPHVDFNDRDRRRDPAIIISSQPVRRVDRTCWGCMLVGVFFGAVQPSEPSHGLVGPQDVMSFQSHLQLDVHEYGGHLEYLWPAG